jgi:DNA mismatch repair protein MutS2
MNAWAIEKTELNKILSLVANYAVLDETKETLKNTLPVSVLAEVKKSLLKTEECVTLLFTHGVSKIEYFPPFTDEISRAKKGSALSLAELLNVGNLLRSVRIAHTSIAGVNDETIVQMKGLADNLYFDAALEDDITTKILSDTEVSDYASDRLYIKMKGQEWFFYTNIQANGYIEVTYYFDKNGSVMVDNRYIDFSQFINEYDVGMHLQETPATYFVYPLNYFYCETKQGVIFDKNVGEQNGRSKSKHGKRMQ